MGKLFSLVNMGVTLAREASNAKKVRDIQSTTARPIQDDHFFEGQQVPHEYNSGHHSVPNGPQDFYHTPGSENNPVEIDSIPVSRVSPVHESGSPQNPTELYTPGSDEYEYAQDVAVSSLPPTDEKRPLPVDPRDEPAQNVDASCQHTPTPVQAEAPEYMYPSPISGPSTPVEQSRGGKLPCPVIIPQRRPENKERGFLVAYAPVLYECGIDEPTFLNFIYDLNQSSKVSTMYGVVNMGAFAAGLTPNIASQAAAAAAAIAVRSMKGREIGKQTNKFLDQANEEIFKPCGLYAIIMTYKPEDQTQPTSTAPRIVDNLLNQYPRRFEKSGGNGISSATMPALPESAPLVFPQAKSQSKGVGIASYYDKKAQEKYAMEQPGSSLSYNIGGSGSGGYSRREVEDQRQKAFKEQAKLMGGFKSRGSSSQKSAIVGAIQRSLKQDVLYLMIVNLPSEEEMNAALHNNSGNSPAQQQQNLFTTGNVASPPSPVSPQRYSSPVQSQQYAIHDQNGFQHGATPYYPPQSQSVSPGEPPAGPPPTYQP